MSSTETSFVTERGINQLPHPNPNVRARLREVSLSDCRNGCKIYEDPKTRELYLVHSATYGCNKTKRALERASEAEFADLFSGRDYWMVPIKDRLDQATFHALTTRTTGKSFQTNAKPLKEAFSSIVEAAERATEAMGTLRVEHERPRTYPTPRRPKR